MDDVLGIDQGRICLQRLYPYAWVDCNLTLCWLQSQLQHNYGQPYVRVDLYLMPESTWTLCRLYCPVMD